MRFIWNAEMNDKLVEMFNEGKSANEIADYFTCENSQLYSHSRSIGLYFKDRNGLIEEESKQRLKQSREVELPCLRCKQVFISKWEGNRLCNDCCRLNAGYVGVVYG